MNIETIRKMYNSQPFKPFIFHLVDGREILVPHRDFMFVAPSGREVIVYQQDSSFNIIDTLLVSDVEVRPNLQVGSGDNNGSGKK